MKELICVQPQTKRSAWLAQISVAGTRFDDSIGLVADCDRTQVLIFHVLLSNLSIWPTSINLPIYLSVLFLYRSGLGNVHLTDSGNVN